MTIKADQEAKQKRILEENGGAVNHEEDSVGFQVEPKAIKRGQIAAN
jgi:hypothetical protein